MSDEKTLRAAHANAQQALAQLEEFLRRQPQDDDLVRAAIVQAFEFTFETTWKLLQKVAAVEGVVVHSPRSAIAYGFQRGLWPQEQPWLGMLRDRNLTVHTYNRSLALLIVENIRSHHCGALRHAIVTLGSTLPQ